MKEADMDCAQQPSNASANNDRCGLQLPLSELIDDLDHQLDEIRQFVHRVPEDRTCKGKLSSEIKRPLNCFFLYKKAVRAFAKSLFLGSNQNTLSRLIATSWHIETADVKKRFKALAETEKYNHKKAFPNYIYTPSKGRVNHARSTSQT